MWFKMSSDLFESRIFKICALSTGRGDRNAQNRVLMLIRVFSESAEGMIWKDADELAALFKAPKKDAERVWNLCIDDAVLRPVNNGFNAFDYMKENALFGDMRPKEDIQNLTMQSKNFF